MVYTVSITSQGQMSIPAKLRKKLGLEKYKKALVLEREGELIVRPVKDFLELGGSLKTSIKATPRQVRKAFEDYLAKQALGIDE